MILTCLLTAALSAPADAKCSIRLTDVTPSTGIAFRHTDGSSGQRYIVEYVSAGLAVFDYDGDGDEDIYFLSGSALPGSKQDLAPTNALYRNDGQWRFTDVTEEAGVGDSGHGLGVAAGDHDSDGDLDLYLNNFGQNVLYRNNGNGTFTDVTSEAGVGNGNRVGAGTSFLDIDGDGDLDLYVSNYVKFSFDDHIHHSMKGVSSYPSPLDFAPTSDILYRNNGDGTFADVSFESGIGRHAGSGMGMTCADYDNDGDTDIFVGNDVMANFLFQNDGGGNFTEVGSLSGFAYDIGGIPHGSMGVACGDYDRDGWLDFCVTSFRGELATLYQNLGIGCFDDVTRLAGSLQVTQPYVTWGNGFVDLDNDGDLDLFIACGDLDDNAALRDDTAMYRTKNLVLENTGGGQFVNVSDAAGDGMAAEHSSRGAGFGDLDNDGDLDAVILNSRDAPTLLRNDTKLDHHWIQFRLQGLTNRNGVGARVRVVAGELSQIAEVHCGRGYQGDWGKRLHFGLGEESRVDRVEVRWIGGATETFGQMEVDTLHVLREGSGSP
jgi:enediyne biosynthesis protein E4